MAYAAGLGEGVEVARVRLAEPRRIGHQPARVDVVREGADRDAHDVAGERERSRHAHRAWAVAPETSMASISSPPNPASPSTSTLCSPRRGGRRRISPGVLLYVVGISGMRSVPSLGCSTIFQKPVASSWGSVRSDSRVLTMVAGTFARSSASSHSAELRVATILPSSL